jgi:hypothetical protein
MHEKPSKYIAYIIQTTSNNANMSLSRWVNKSTLASCSKLFKNTRWSYHGNNEIVSQVPWASLFFSYLPWNKKLTIVLYLYNSVGPPVILFSNLKTKVKTFLVI